MEPIVNTVIITQARTGSSRLPNKILLKVNGEELLKIHTDRLKKVKSANKIIVATTTNTNDAAIKNICEKWGNLDVFCGSEDDVLDRFYNACKEYNPQWVVRVTSDCPLLDPELVDAVILFAKTNDVDYCSNTLVENFPDGQDVEVMKFSSLKTAWEKAALKSEREHVTPYIRKHATINGGNLFTSMNFPCSGDYSKIRMTVDEQRDFDLIEKLIQQIGCNASWLDYAKHIINHQLNTINESIARNEGYFKSLNND